VEFIEGRTDMLLKNKNAVIYGGGGAIARAFAREGARVFLAGRTLAKLDGVAKDISAAGGVAETAQVDALDEQSVEKHIAEVAKKLEAMMSPSTPSGWKTFRELRSRRCRLRNSLVRSQSQPERSS